MNVDPIPEPKGPETKNEDKKIAKKPALKVRLMNAYIAYKQNNGKGYTNPEPGLILVIIPHKDHHIKKEIKLTNLPTYGDLAVVKNIFKSDIQITEYDVEEYIHGVKYVARICNPIVGDTRKIYPLVHRESVMYQLHSVSLMTKNKHIDITKYCSKFLGKYQMGIENSFRKIYRSNYKSFSRIALGDVIIVKVHDLMNEGIVTREHEVGVDLTYNDLFTEFLV